VEKNPPRRRTSSHRARSSPHSLGLLPRLSHQPLGHRRRGRGDGAGPSRLLILRMATRSGFTLFAANHRDPPPVMSDEEVEKDLETAGSAIQTFAPGGLWGLAMGGALALMALVAGT